ncbi:MAG: BON domain-containing protein [Candidatus Tectomicrobia bacterium]|uniref:BON domain-containing protein n=1 Tax=Tectimicrobiota bacterium TaxID=2528274 RepID=A0A932FU81_UNCTE|nr:BON domain-containing protein [Candidatus Tectomicrobia bacterium]
MNDAAITAEVKAKLASDVRLATLTNIDVTTVNGVVTLAGQVRTGEESQMAEQVTKSIQGVKQVNNALQVVPPTG